MANYTGLTDITIPIHKVKSTKLTLPITMSFHASGRMANESNGILGIRWTLNCGGLVSRIIKGAPDEWNFLTPYTVYNNDIPTYDALYRACPDGKILHAPNNDNHTNYDTEYDLFSYSLPNGKSGHFILKNQDSIKVPMLIPNDGLKIEYAKAATNNGFIDNITITDIDGTKYLFGKIDASTSNAIETIENPDFYNGQITTSIPTAWYLTKIISSDKTDQISILYNNLSTYPVTYSQNTSVYDSYRDYNDSWFDSPSDDPYQDYLRDLIYTYHFKKDQISSTTSHRDVPNISKVMFNGGSVYLNYLKVGSDSLLNTLVVNSGAIPYKKVEFKLSRHANETEICYLDSLLFYGEAGTQVGDTYGFSYFENDAFPASSDYRNIDWWGYASYVNNDLIPSQSIQITPAPGRDPSAVYRDIGYTSTNRNPDGIRSLTTGMLKEITYPTGGQTEFVYENNLYAADNYLPGQNQAMKEGPGIRIKEIISKPVYGKNIHKRYKYGIYEDGRGYINELLRPGSSSRTDLAMEEGNTMHYWKYYPDATTDNSFQTGYRTREYLSESYVRFDLAGSPIKYDAVTEYYFDENTSLQRKTQSRYSWGNNEQVKNFIITDHGLSYHNERKFADPENAWRTPVLTEKSYFNYIEGQFNLVKKESYSYYGGVSDEAWDMPTYLHTNIIWLITDNLGNAVPDINYSFAKDYHNTTCSVYGYGFRKYTTGIQQINHLHTEEYLSGTTIATDKYLDYNSDNFLIEVDSTVNSQNKIIKTTYRYPSNYLGILPYSQMVQKNILSPVLESTTIKDRVQINKINTNYYSPFPNVYEPSSVEIKNRNHPQESVATFNKYDKLGNILEQQKTRDVKEVYLWGYNHRYPVSKIVGSDFNTVNSHVDTSILNNGTDAQIKTELAAIRSYFKNSPLVQITTYTYKPFIGITSETDPKGNITFYEYDNFGRLANIRGKDSHLIKNFIYNNAGQPRDYAGNIIYYNSKKTASLMRNNCTADAYGTNVSYTVPAKKYSSIISQSDADLKAQQELNTMGQAYANQVGECYYQNTIKSQVFTRNTCPGGGQVTYTVPAGRYRSIMSQADADQMALNDVSANGQTYANEHGSCSVYLNVAKSSRFNKNDCGTGYTGSSVEYTVPADTYTSNISQADADQQALDDISANGQTYANLHGTCIKVCHFEAVDGDYGIDQSSIVINANGTTKFSITFDIASNQYYHVFEEMAEINIAKIVGDCHTNKIEINDSNGLLWQVRQFSGNLYVQIIDYIESPYDDYLPVTLTWTQ